MIAGATAISTMRGGQAVGHAVIFVIPGCVGARKKRPMRPPFSPEQLLTDRDVGGRLRHGNVSNDCTGLATSWGCETVHFEKFEDC
jgi:WD40 repeat protein